MTDSLSRFDELFLLGGSILGATALQAVSLWWVSLARRREREWRTEERVWRCWRV
ncbi:MAG TPA: hypothetical protein VHC22_32620 [Pirellulales bacterium]|nr:hypothetical protein [Pirellulales bacterium]